MSVGYYPKDSLVSDRALKVQRLSIPFKIVGNATAASVVVSADESFLEIATAGVNQIVVPAGETATYSTSPSDSAGRFNMLVVIKEPINKLVSCEVFDLVLGTLQPTVRGSATGVTLPASGNSAGTAIMLTCTATQAINAANTIDACLQLEYVVNEHQ